MWSNESYPEQSNMDARGYAPQPGPAGQFAPAVYHPQRGVDVPPPQPQVVSALRQGAFDIPEPLAERIELCKLLSESDLVPPRLHNKPANVLLIMHKALALDLPVMVAIEHMHVIDGKVSHSAELLRGLLHRAGHVLRWPTISDKEVVGELTLRHDPRNPRQARFSIADATRMKLTAKDNWTKDPESMMVARVTTRLVSRHCPEIALALGNLSALDFDDDEPAAEPAAAVAAGPTREQQAADLIAEAMATTDRERLKEIGTLGRQHDLLDVPVKGGKDFKTTLLKRMNDVANMPTAEPTFPSTPEPESAAKPAPAERKARG